MGKVFSTVARSNSKDLPARVSYSVDNKLKGNH